jgi:hypothetical protein
LGRQPVHGTVNRRILPLLLLAALMAVGCAQQRPARSGFDGSTSATVPPDRDGRLGRVQLVTPRPGLGDLLPTTWLKAVPSGDGRTLTVSFWGSPCRVVDHVSVQETGDLVTLTLYQAVDPDMDGSGCTEQAVLRAVEVGLTSPLNGRRLADGTPGTPPPALPTEGVGGFSPGPGG